MKRLLFILFGVFIIQSNLHAQHPAWPQPGAEWEICKAIPLVIAPTVYQVSPPIRYEKDTLIDNKTYQITRKLKTNGQIMIEFFTRFNQDTIFRYVNGNEYMFFTYNVAIGDTLFSLRTGTGDYNEETCSYTLELVCLDIYPVNIDGNVLSLYEFTNVDNIVNNPFNGWKYYWIEIIGWVSSFPWLIISQEDYCNSFTEDGDFEFPIHYTDSTRSWPIEFQANGVVCDTLLTLEQEQIEDIAIYPNPAQKEQLLTIDGLESDSRIEIINTVGEIQRFNRINSNQITITNLSEGLYFIKLIGNSDQLYKTVKLLIF